MSPAEVARAAVAGLPAVAANGRSAKPPTKGAQQRIAALLLFERSNTLVDGSADEPAHPINGKHYIPFIGLYVDPHGIDSFAAKRMRTLVRDFVYFLIMVPVEGVEPTCPRGQRILSPPRLPFRHTGPVPLIAAKPRLRQDNFKSPL